MRRPTGRGRRLLFAAVVLASLLGAAELVTRLLVPPQAFVINEVHRYYRDDALLFWSMPPDAQYPMEGYTVRTNSLGLRSDPVALPKPPGTVRILSLGESTTWGHGVAAEQTYSQQLQGLLNQGGRGRFEVVNAGVGAYTVFQSYLYLTRRGYLLEPDVVLLYHEFNDFLPAGVWDRNNFLVDVDVTDRQRFQRRGPLLWLLEALYRSRLYLYARNKLLLERFRERGSPGPPPPGAAPPLRRVPRQDRLFALEEMARFCRERGIRLVIVHPVYEDDVDDCARGCLLVRFAARAGAPLLDLRGRLAARARSDPGFFLDECHPTAHGHGVIAREMYDFLVKSNLLKKK